MSYTDPHGSPPPAPPAQPYGAPPGYPMQPPPARPKSRGCGRALLIVLGAGTALFLLLIAIAIAVGSSDDDDDSGGGGTGQSDGSTEDVYAIGETAHTGDFDVTVHTVTDPYTPSNQFDIQPAAGRRFVAVELTMTNTSDRPQPVSTATGTEMTDHLDRLGSYSLAGASELPRLDTATVAPGEARRGWVVFEVAADATELHLRVKGNLTATGSLFRL